MFSANPATSHTAETSAGEHEVHRQPLPVFRPYQYMGTKLRALDSIVRVAASLAPPGARVVDLFTGSTVVAQAFAAYGYRVDAYDALQFPATTASAVLGVERTNDPSSEFLDQVVAFATRCLHASSMRLWVDREDDALSRRDGATLLSIAAEVPQVWRTSGASGDVSRLLTNTARAVGQPASASTPIATTHYAGTYFGVRQAVLLDGLRLAIDELGVDGWLRSAALTSLTSAMSAAAFTPGKHFAQPHKIRDGKDLEFHRERALADRSIDVIRVFVMTLRTLVSSPHRATGHHRAEQVTFEEHCKRSPRRIADLIYADPPYTAQQYSRFYHVPETMILGRVPRLQIHRDSVTAGIYSEDKFKSRFCSKRSAIAAFEDLLDLARAHRTPLMISYAASASGRSGNDRMVSMEQLLTRMRERGFKSVSVEPLDHNYRQLNNSSLAVSGRDDQEFILYGTPGC